MMRITEQTTKPLDEIIEKQALFEQIVQSLTDSIKVN